MKRSIVILIFMLPIFLAAQNIEWTWIEGNDSVNFSGIYESGPGSRNGSISWRDISGNLWLFGGKGVDKNGNEGPLNDLWKWDGTNWIWISGGDTVNQSGNYGAKGKASESNIPGARDLSISWTDTIGNFWLFGGRGIDKRGRTRQNLNDLWKWDGTNWTWVSGSDTGYQYGEYGIKGVKSPNCKPGARFYSISSTDASGNLLLFGGVGWDKNGKYGYFNDLWKWDGVSWTWLSGSDTINQYANYGIKGKSSKSNIPGARHNSISWKDTSGNFWLFGGYGLTTIKGSWGVLNDLWKWDGTNWTWVSGSNISSQSGVYGIKGTSNSNNIPGARQSSISWMDTSGNFWLFGGSGYNSTKVSNVSLNDLWKWDGANWTWLSGDDVNYLGNDNLFGTKGVPDSSNVPNRRHNAISWTDTFGNLWMFGGNLTGGYFVNDLWKWDGVYWTWVSGSDTSGQKGIYHTIKPGARHSALSWKDTTDLFWLFGGEGYDRNGSKGYLNDLWNWNGTSWNWISGSDTIHQAGLYGVIGVATIDNVPGVRKSAMTWIDSVGSLWLFGGEGYDKNGNKGYLSDLWKWDGVNWTWVSGRDTIGSVGVYGVKGSGRVNNIPGGRISSSNWIDSIGDLWLYGGYGIDKNGRIGYLNDLWRWDGLIWTWVSGRDTTGSSGVYGAKGSTGVNNIPSGRYSSYNWKDSNGDFWLFGGQGYSKFGSVGFLNDLWKWDGRIWTWIQGSDTINEYGKYGNIGKGSSTNIPGARAFGTNWLDSSGNIYLFGGYGYAKNSLGYLNDLWKWDGVNWTWESGIDTVNQSGRYGFKRANVSDNIPGGRLKITGWSGKSGEFWLFGGEGKDKSNNIGYLNDLWKVFPCKVKIGFDTIVSCGSYTWIDRNTYTESTDTVTYNIIGGASNGCDSIVTLNLSIIYPSLGNDTIVSCDSFKWLNGKTYFSSNDTAKHTIVGGNVNGCDSLVTLNLTINKRSFGVDSITSCDSFLWIDGNNYFSSTDSAQHIIVGGNVNGCDSLVRLNLIINKSTYRIDSITSCNNYKWIDNKTYTMSNDSAIYIIPGGSFNGCDSLVLLNLIINSVSDVSISTIGLVLKANNSKATSFQWFDCDSSMKVILGETKSSYNVTRNGSFATEIIENGCIDTSECVTFTTVGILENSFVNGVTIYPNPTKGNLGLRFENIQKEVRITLYSLSGKTLKSYEPFQNSKQIDIRINEPHGVYLLEILNEREEKVVMRVIVD